MAPKTSRGEILIRADLEYPSNDAHLECPADFVSDIAVVDDVVAAAEAEDLVVVDEAFVDVAVVVGTVVEVAADADCEEIAAVGPIGILLLGHVAKGTETAVALPNRNTVGCSVQLFDARNYQTPLEKALLVV